MFWLGRALDAAGYEAFPAKSVPDAFELITEFHINICLLILNCALDGAEGLVAGLRTADPNIKVMALIATDDCEPLPAFIDAECRKPADMSEASRTALVYAIGQLLARKAAAS